MHGIGRSYYNDIRFDRSVKNFLVIRFVVLSVASSKNLRVTGSYVQYVSENPVYLLFYQKKGGFNGK